MSQSQQTSSPNPIVKAKLAEWEMHRALEAAEIAVAAAKSYTDAVIRFTNNTNPNTRAAVVQASRAAMIATAEVTCAFERAQGAIAYVSVGEALE